ERDSLERQTHRALLEALAVGEITTELIARCGGSGVPLHQRALVALAIRPLVTGVEASYTTTAGTAQIAAETAAAIHMYNMSALVAVVDDLVMILISHDPEVSTDDLLEVLAQEIHRR